jgi:hypothetical protein
MISGCGLEVGSGGIGPSRKPSVAGANVAIGAILPVRRAKAPRRVSAVSGRSRTSTLAQRTYAFVRSKSRRHSHRVFHSCRYPMAVLCRATSTGCWSPAGTSPATRRATHSCARSRNAGSPARRPALWQRLRWPSAARRARCRWRNCRRRCGGNRYCCAPRSSRYSLQSIRSIRMTL